MKKKRPSTGKIVNRRARFDYELGDDLVVGVKLNGRETKSLRQGHAHLRGAFVTLKNHELVLSNATIASGKTFIIPDTEQTQPRILLAKRKEIDALQAAKDSGKSIVPLEFLTSGRYVKLRIAIGKGKKRYDKRQTIKERDQARDIRNIA
jgi:SsrA-binding protein